jgi:NADPH:quinone reductase-like Zn-dependent oxidoreductase
VGEGLSSSRPSKQAAVALRQIPTPTSQSGEVLVRVHEVGIDRTDAEILEGQYGEAVYRKSFCRDRTMSRR